ncbi:MAG: DUF4445 domain-containing protein [Armatimonadetes bacterium]|nr:DUF4445 domain-containing protein [Armatimonadota bacterium]
MGRYTITVEPLNRQIVAEKGKTILEALQQAAIAIPADCGGQGLCHRCRVLLVSGRVDKVDPQRWWEEETPAGKWILACMALPASDLSVRLSPQALAGGLVGLSQIAVSKEQIENAVGACDWPLAYRLRFEVSPPTNDDNLPDLQRIERAIRERDARLPPLTATVGVLRRMPRVLRAGAFRLDVFVADRGCYRELFDLRSHESEKPLLGLAADIGTTTVTVKLVDLEGGQLLGEAAGANAQGRYGADVITRSIWAEEHEDGLRRMQQLVIDQLSEYACELAEGAGYTAEDIVAASLAGNTTMLTFALGADTSPIRRAPHIPLARQLPVLHAADIGLRIHPDAPVFMAPAVSGFVGGDITAGILATGIAHADEVSLLVDVGTNGEIVLGNKDWLVCCSCSAGPAFEGVDIEAGVRAVPGAIDRITYDPDQDRFLYETIASRPPIGLCGTGLLEALAAMFRAGLVDRSGHLIEGASPRVRSGEHEPEIVIASQEESGTGREIVLRESEIENLLRSKAAIYAGISCLLDALSLTPDMVQRVYLAGAFGNRLRVEEAVTIGLLPDIPRDRIVFAGNTSLAGAYLAILCRQAREQLEEIAAKMAYLELSTSTKFMEEFISALFLPHTDLSRFSLSGSGPGQ